MLKRILSISVIKGVLSAFLIASANAQISMTPGAAYLNPGKAPSGFLFSGAPAIALGKTVDFGVSFGYFEKTQRSFPGVEAPEVSHRIINITAGLTWRKAITSEMKLFGVIPFSLSLDAGYIIKAEGGYVFLHRKVGSADESARDSDWRGALVTLEGGLFLGPPDGSNLTITLLVNIANPKLRNSETGAQDDAFNLSGVGIKLGYRLKI